MVTKLVVSKNFVNIYYIDLDPALAWVGVKNSGRGCTLVNC